MPTILSRNIATGTAEKSKYWIYPACATNRNSDVWATRVTKVRFENYYDGPESRPKPDRLIENLTARGPLARSLHCYRLDQETTTYKSFLAGCSGPQTWHEVVTGRYPTPAFPAFTDDLAGIALVDLRLKIKDYQQNLADYVGEARETFDTFAAAGEKVVDTVRRVKRYAGTGATFRRPGGKLFSIPKDWRRWIKKVPATWLVTAFVLLPALKDAEVAVERAQTWDTKPLKRRIVVTKRKELEAETSGTYGGSITHKGVLSKRYVVYVTYQPDLGSVTAGNLGEAIWAGLPFTWVLDYFATVGDWLSSLDAMSGVSSFTGCATTLERRYSFDNRRMTSKTQVLEPGTFEQVSYKREVLSSIPQGRPSWNPSGSWKRLTNLSAVLASFKL